MPPRRSSARAVAAFVAPRDFIWNDDLPVDLDGHGTHVAGTIGQLTNNSIGAAGMAYNVRLMPVKVIQGVWDEIFGSPFDGTDDVVARGIRYAADNGAKVINMSIGRDDGGPAPVVTDAIRYAVSRGVLRRRRLGQHARRPATRPSASRNRRPTSTAWSPSAPSAARSTSRSTRPRDRTSRLSAPGGDQRQGGTTAGILQQTLDLDLLETYERPVSQFGPPRADVVRLLLLPGHVDGDAARVGVRGAADAAGHHQSRRRSKPR